MFNNKNQSQDRLVSVTNMEEIEPKESLCISVDNPEKSFAIAGDIADENVDIENLPGLVYTHNSVVQRNIINSCVMRPDRWRLLGVDLKRVELSFYRQFKEVVMGVAVTLPDALTTLRFGEQVMMKRYDEMEQSGINDIDDFETPPKKLMIMIDELAQLTSPSGVKALAGSTWVATPNGAKRLDEVQVGDVVLDNRYRETVVTKKYQPQSQQRYELSVRRESDNIVENFHSGSEHYWVAYITDSEGRVSGPRLMTTQQLHDFKREQEKVSEDKRKTIRFKRSKHPVSASS